MRHEWPNPEPNRPAFWVNDTATNASEVTLRREILRLVGERARIRRELLEWLVGDCPADAGLVGGRRIVDEIDRIIPEP